MPHSGGGGSHSGGSHGGSHSSSHSGGSGSSSRTSSKPFKGCRTFVVYNKRKQPKMVYSNTDYNREISLGELIFSCIFTGIFALFPILMMVGSFALMLQFGHKPITSPTDTEIQIIDNYNLVTQTEKEELRESLTRFYEITGAVPAVEFTTDDTWYDDYNTCEDFAYNEYVTNFSDEKHVLIIYSYGYSNEETGFNEFHWESMYGDELGRAVTTKDETTMLSIMQKNLTKANGHNVAHAIALSFDELSEQVSDTSIHFAERDMIITGLFLFFFAVLFLLIILIPIISTIKKYKLLKNGCIHEVYKGMLQKNCAYCGCMYIVGTISSCPHCGAAIPAFDPTSIENI